MHLALGSVVLNPLDVVLKGIYLVSGIYRFRLFRMVAALLVGSLLSISGFLIQVCTRNPLGDPYLLGISSGALFAVTLTFVFPPQSPLVFILRPLVAFIGGFLAYTLTHAIAMKAGYTPTSIVLSGVAVGTTLYSLSLLPQYLILFDIHKVFAWSMGSLIGAGPIELLTCLVILVGAYAIAHRYLPVLNALNVSDDFVRELGYDPGKLRRTMTGLAALTASITVAWFGIIGFIGLAAPHIARRLLGSGDVRYVLPTSIITGSVLLLLSDTAAKTLFLPLDMPVNIIVSAIGGPTLAIVLMRMRKYASS